MFAEKVLKEAAMTHSKALNENYPGVTEKSRESWQNRWCTVPNNLEHLSLLRPALC